LGGRHVRVATTCRTRVSPRGIEGNLVSHELQIQELVALYGLAAASSSAREASITRYETEEASALRFLF
jgi:hypothetical protein